MSTASGKSAAVAAYYDKAAGIVPEFTVLNYGFSADDEPTVVDPGHPERFCLRLYEHTLRHTNLAAKDVLEVSCGRGGGAEWLYDMFHPARYVGLDLSEENVRMANALRHGPEFRLGDAEALPFPDATFDVVINIEASHLYENRRRFFAEAFRVLKPGGHFCYTDGCWANDDCTSDLLDAGFELRERREITGQVIDALERDTARREQLFDAMAADDDLKREYKDWGGVVGFRAYRRFVDRETLYFSHWLVKPVG